MAAPFGIDKVKHFGYLFFGVAITYFILHYVIQLHEDKYISHIISGLLAIIVGKLVALLKEKVWDDMMGKGHSSVDDIAAGYLGIYLAAFFIFGLY